MKKSLSLPQPGDVFEFPYPFVREKFSYMDEEGAASMDCWKPGVRMEPRYDDVDAIADSTGAQILAVVSVHKPGKFPTRIFYTRKWRDPDGKEFGKGTLRIISVSGWRTLLKGYRYEFVLNGKRLELAEAMR